LKVLEQPTWLDRLRLTSRQAGLTFNPNALGAVTVLIGVFALSILPMMPFGLLAISQMFLGVFISGSRNALISLLACLVALYGLNAKNLRMAVLIFACVVTFIGFSIWLFDGNVRFLEFQKEENQISRVHLGIEAVKQSMKSPISGFGFEGMKILNGTLNERLVIPSPVEHTHNLFAQSYLEQGLIGLTMILSLIFIGIFSAMKQQSKTALVALTAILSFNTGDYFFYYAPFQITFWMILHGLRIAQPSAPMMLPVPVVLRET
jgi:O-antigen ligase